MFEHETNYQTECLYRYFDTLSHQGFFQFLVFTYLGGSLVDLFCFLTQDTKSWSVMPVGVSLDSTRFSGCEVNTVSMVEAEVAVVSVGWSIS